MRLGLIVGTGMLLGAAAVGAAGTQGSPPGFTMDRTGSREDFAYFEGGWTTVQHKLKARGSAEWQTFPGNLCMTRHLEGLVTVDELHFPTLGRSGLTLRTFDPARHQWSIYWVSSATGKLDPVPVVGGFGGNRGEFYAEDKVSGVPVKVRYLWLISDHDHARWEQAFSYDDRTWETNWTADFTRADAPRICDHGRPKP